MVGSSNALSGSASSSQWDPFSCRTAPGRFCAGGALPLCGTTADDSDVCLAKVLSRNAFARMGINRSAARTRQEGARQRRKHCEATSSDVTRRSQRILATANRIDACWASEAKTLWQNPIEWLVVPVVRPSSVRAHIIVVMCITI
jgi:hypothetical protein